MNRRFSLVMAVAAFAALFAFTSIASAAVTFGPVNQNTGFPKFIGDRTGKPGQVALCLDAAPFCEPTAVIPDNDQSVATGFGSEATYFSVGADVRPGRAPNVRIRVEFSLLATYANDLGIPRRAGVVVINGKLIDIAGPNGTYTVEHFYGQDRVTVTAGAGSVIQEFIGKPADNFARARTGPVQFFMRHVTPSNPAYLGTEVARPVEGSTLRNFVRITGPAGANIGGVRATPNILEITNFSVSGKRAKPNTAPLP